MTLEKLYEMGLINDETVIFIKITENPYGASYCGRWFQGRAKRYMKNRVSYFEWKDNNLLYAIVKNEEEKNEQTKAD